MKYEVVILPDAKQDLKLAAVWYNKRRKGGLGKKFLNRIRQSKKVLRSNPHFVKRNRNIHTLPLRQFPFMIHFMIDESKKVVTVLAVLHSSQNPEKWPNE